MACCWDGISVSNACSWDDSCLLLESNWTEMECRFIHFMQNKCIKNTVGVQSMEEGEHGRKRTSWGENCGVKSLNSGKQWMTGANQ